MKVKIKVAGTTFHPLPQGVGIAIDQEFEMEQIPCASVKAVLVPEPENQYDPEAVKVMLPLTDGKAHHLGYIPKAEPLKTQIKVPKIAHLVIKDYGQVGDYNASYIIMEIEGV